jgi:hypothetical protein
MKIYVSLTFYSLSILLSHCSNTTKIKMDPIAFFDHLAANSITSQSSRTDSIDDRESYNKHQLATTLDTIKPLKDQIFQDKWIEIIHNYRQEKEGLTELVLYR